MSSMTRKQRGLDLGSSLDCRLCPSANGSSRQHSEVRARASSLPRSLSRQNSRAHLIKTTAPKHRLALYNMSCQVKASVAETAGIWIGQQSCTWLPTAAVAKGWPLPQAEAIASGWPRTHCVTRAHSWFLRTAPQGGLHYELRAHRAWGEGREDWAASCHFALPVPPPPAPATFICWPALSKRKGRRTDRRTDGRAATPRGAAVNGMIRTALLRSWHLSQGAGGGVGGGA